MWVHLCKEQQCTFALHFCAFTQTTGIKGRGEQRIECQKGTKSLVHEAKLENIPLKMVFRFSSPISLIVAESSFTFKGQRC